MYESLLASEINLNWKRQSRNLLDTENLQSLEVKLNENVCICCRLNIAQIDLSQLFRTI